MMIQKKHSGIKFRYETKHNTWCIFTKKGTLLIRVGFDLKNQYIVYKYLTEVNGKCCLSSERTKNLNDLKLLLPKLEAISAFDK